MQSYEDIINNLIGELRRGTLIISVLSQLEEQEYGYSLIHKLQEKGMNIDSNTLYPLLRRLETQGLLCSELITIQEKPRKYYQKTELGNKVYHEVIKQWHEIQNSIENLTRGNEDGNK